VTEIPVSTYKQLTPVARVVWLFVLVLLMGCDEQQTSPQTPIQASLTAPDSTLPVGIQSPASRQTPDSHLPEVRVLPIRPGAHRARISAFGEVEPRYRLNLDTQVSGRVVGLAKAFETGAMVSKGQLLARLDDTEYRADLLNAQQQLMSAQIRLLEVQENARQSKADWNASGFSEDLKLSALASGDPQLELARVQLAAARADLELAGHRLENTRIRAPFDGLITSRQVSPGSLLEEGDAVATLFNVELAEVAVSVTNAQWLQLPAGQLKAEVREVEFNVADSATPSWSGYLLRVNKHLDANTRQRTLVIAVDQPLQQTPPLLPGAFVSVMLEGQLVTEVFRVPESAISPSGRVWAVEQVREHGRLRSLNAQVVFRQDQDVVIRIPEALALASPVQLVAQPLASYLEGMAVNPIVDSNLARRYPLVPVVSDDPLRMESVE
jgi:membrane fusion protein (multidrug efflux system)